MLILIVTSLLLETVGSRMPRTVWMYERSAHWWNHIVLETFTDSDWLENFHVSRTAFVYLCSELQSAIAKKRRRFRRPISVQKRVAITLWVLYSNHYRILDCRSSSWCSPMYSVLYCAGDLQVHCSHFITKVYSVSSWQQLACNSSRIS